MAIQDGQFLNDALESAKGDISLALTKFNQSRFTTVRQTQALDLVRIYIRMSCLRMYAQVAGAPFLEHKGIRQLLPTLVMMHNVSHMIGNKYMPWLVPKPVLVRFQQAEVSVHEAIQILKRELVALLSTFLKSIVLILWCRVVIAAAVSSVSVKASISLF